MRRPPHWARAAGVVALCLVATSAQGAPMILEGFESALPPYVGHGFLDDGTVGGGPIQGTSQGILTTDASAGAVDESVVGDAFENSIFSVDIADNLPSKIWKSQLDKMGLSDASGVNEGSALQITFTTDPGEFVAISFDFLTNDVSRDPTLYTDFAWYELNPPTGKKDTGVLAHTNQGGFQTFSGPDYEHHTGEQTMFIDASAGGTYTLTIGVNDVEDSFRDSALVIDWLRLVTGPEPGTFGTVALGLVGLQLYSRRLRRRS